MGLRTVGIFLILMLLAVGMLPLPTSTAQNRELTGATYSATPKNPDQRPKPPALRVLTADEGLAVLSAALESRAHPDFGTDCSHLVHAIYERAGFSYSYESSSSLYAGSDEFRRVARPQPGDLVVWPGHVGIAVNPAQHSFFSALRSGLGVASYDSAYWKERGRPRFLRYVTDAPANDVPASSRESNLKTAASPEPRPPGTRNASLATREETQPQADPGRSIPTFPSVKTIHSKRPTPDDVTDAVEQVLSETGEPVRGLDLINPSKRFIVFDQLSVERVHLQRDRGWADINIVGALKLSSQKTNSIKHNERQRWPLVRRDRDTWEITVPPDEIYIQSDSAVRMLAHQLAALTDETAQQTSAATEKLQLSRLLNAFLEKP
jgi:NlpC/P60 family